MEAEWNSDSRSVQHSFAVAVADTFYPKFLFDCIVLYIYSYLHDRLFGERKMQILLSNNCFPYDFTFLKAARLFVCFLPTRIADPNIH